MSELLKYNPETKTVSCSPEAVTDAVSTLKPTADEAKNALANCNKNIDEENWKKGISTLTYRTLLNEGFARDQEKLAKLLGLNSVTTRFEDQNSKVAMERFKAHTKATVAIRDAVAKQNIAEQRDAIKWSAEEEKKTANNAYAGFESFGKKLQGVFGTKKTQ